MAGIGKKGDSFKMSKDFSVPHIDGDETVVGIHASGVVLEEGLNTSNSRNYCSNCKKKIHCYVKIDKNTKEAEIHITCKSSDCECKCRTHFACKKCGYLHPYGQKCNYMESEPHYTPEADTAFEELMKSWRKNNDEKKSTIQKTK